jgi:hypothetical protein
MSKFIVLILFSIISEITIAQVNYKELIKFRFLDKVEAHYVGNLLTDWQTSSARI